MSDTVGTAYSFSGESPPRISFWRYLMTFRADDSPWGDLARDAHQDRRTRCLTKFSGRAFERHIEEEHGSYDRRALEVFDEVYTSWKANR